MFFFSIFLGAMEEFAFLCHKTPFGDLPIYAAPDSSEVRQSRLFRLRRTRFSHVAGVPPDYFNEMVRPGNLMTGAP